MSTMTVSPPYDALYSFLNARGAAAEISLTFDEIEALLGCELPPVARLHKEWWTDGDSSVDSPQLRAWLLAGRKAYANLFARSVSFERAASARR